MYTGIRLCDINYSPWGNPIKKFNRKQTFNKISTLPTKDNHDELKIKFYTKIYSNDLTRFSIKKKKIFQK